MQLVSVFAFSTNNKIKSLISNGQKENSTKSHQNKGWGEDVDRGQRRDNTDPYSIDRAFTGQTPTHKRKKEKMLVK